MSNFSEITLNDGRKVQYEAVRDTFLKHTCLDTRECLTCSDYREVMTGEVPLKVVYHPSIKPPEPDRFEHC